MQSIAKNVTNKWWLLVLQGILAIIFGAVGYSRTKKGTATNRGSAIAGLVLGILTMFGLGFFIWLAS